MNTYLKESKQVFQVRNEEVEVISTFRFDEETDTIVYDEELDNHAINEAFGIYRTKHHFLDKDEIKNIREKYGLSQRAFAKLLGWSPATVTRYESGALPTKNNNSILKNLRDNQELMRSFLNQNKDALSLVEREQLENRLNELNQENQKNDLIELIENRFEDLGISIMSGYQKFNFDKTKQMILYFASQVPSLSKTKLNKLLFYSDFLNFKKATVSISGMTYIHDYYGPVPKYNSLIYSALEDQEVVEWQPFSDSPGEKIIAKVPFDFSYFSKQEIQLLEKVVACFEKDKASEISEKSHEEQAYLETELKEEISYKFAQSLKYIS